MHYFENFGITQGTVGLEHTFFTPTITDLASMPFSNEERYGH
jgi:hypothetical protein